MEGKVKLPEGYQTVMPSLISKDASAFLDFLKKVFNAKENEKMRMQAPDGSKIYHCQAIISGCILMFCDPTDTVKSFDFGLSKVFAKFLKF